MTGPFGGKPCREERGGSNYMGLKLGKVLAEKSMIIKIKPTRRIIKRRESHQVKKG